MLRPAMKYTLSSTTLTSHECFRVNQSYLPTLLSKSSFNQSAKQLLLFGPPSLSAFSFTNTWTNQGIAQIQLLLGHLRKNEEIGVLTNILLETLQLVIGSSLPHFHYPLTQVLKYCTHNWFLNVWDFLLSIHGTIHLERAWKLELQRTNDVSLMDSFMMHVPHLPPQDLKCLNACCIFLQVITLADITDGSGTHILPSSLQGTRHNDWHSSYTWPHQIRPSPEAWRVWCKTLCTQFCTISASNRLQRPLGIWQHNGLLHQKWTYLVDLPSNHLFQRLEGAGTFFAVPTILPKKFLVVP